MNMPERNAAKLTPEQFIDDLAELDEQEANVGADSSEAADSTIRSLKADLDTLAAHLREPSPGVPFEEESDCRRAMELVAALGREPSRVSQHDPEARSPEQSHLGELGQYRLLAVLGKGGMGTVYRALHTKLEKVVALKVLPHERTDNQQAVARFEQEMRAVGRLEHANIVRAMDANEDSGTHYLVMEYVDGTDLSELVRRLGPLTIADACELVRQAAVGLQHAHEHSLVHRDIKPSNVMLTTDGQVKILDLGLARLHNGGRAELTTTGQMMGTVDYMAPEQTGDSRDVDIRADIYSLGATLFKLLAGRAPYDEPKYNTVVKKLAAVGTQPVPSIQEQRTDVPDELAAIVSKMLAKESEGRFATPAEVVEALGSFTEAADLSSLLARHREAKEGEADAPPVVEPVSKGTEEHLSSSMTETRSTATKRDELEESSLGTPAQPAPLPTSVSTTEQEHPTRETAPTTPRTAGSPTWWNRRTQVAAVVLGLAGLFVAVTIIRIVTDKGEIRVTAYDPKIEVTIKRNGEQVDGFQVKQRPGATSFYSGDYEIEITGGTPDGVKIKNQTFRLTRKEEVLVEIVRVGQAVPDEIPPGSASRGAATGDPHRRIAEWVLRQGGRVSARHWGRHVSAIDDLPATEFTLVFVGLHRSNVTDQDLEILKDIDTLTGVSLDECEQITDGAIQYLRHNRDLKQMILGENATTNITDRTAQSLSAFPELTELNLNCRITDAGVRHIATLSKLKKLAINSPEITDQGIAHLASLKELEYLLLAQMRLSDESMRHLVGLPLTELHFMFTATGDRAVEILAAASSLEVLGIEGSGQLTDVGLGHLAKYPKLTSLYIKQEPKVTDAGVAHVGELVHLKRLQLQSVSVTDAGLAHLRKLTEIEYLDLRLPITDAGVEHLSALHNLRELYLAEVKLSSAGIERLRQALPECQIYVNGQALPLASAPVALVSAPTHLPGVKSWTIETIGHRSAVRAVAYSPDGQVLATAGKDGTIRLWDPATGQLQQSFVGHGSQVSSLAWSPDGRTLASASYDHTIRLWDAKAGSKLRTLSGHESPVLTVAWSPDGSKLASGEKSLKVRLWDVESGRSLHVLHGRHDILSVAWSPDGKTVASTAPGSGETTVQLWNAETGQAVAILSEHAEARWCVWSPDGTTLAVADADHKVRLWDSESRKVVKELDDRAPQVYQKNSVVWSPDGGSLAVAGRQTIVLWDIGTGGVLKTMSTTGSGMVVDASVAWSPDGEVLASGNPDGTVQLWNVGTGQAVRTITGYGNDVYSIAWSPDGQALVSAAYYDINRRWALKPGQAFLTLEEPGTQTVAWSPDERTVASSGASFMIRLWDTQSGELRKTLDGGDRHYGVCVAFSPNGKTLASTGHTEVFLWDIESGEKLRTLSGHTDTVSWVTWSADGNMLATSSQDRTSRVWNAETGQSLQTLPCGSHHGPVFSPDSRTLAYERGDGVRLLDVETEQETGTLPVSATSLAWSPNVRILATSEASGMIRTWDLESGQPLMDFTGHTDGYMASLAWSPDGRVLASGSFDGTIRLWDANIGQALGVLVPLGSDQAVIISAEGHYRGSPRVEQNLVYVVQTDAGQETLTPEEFAEKYGWKNDPSKVECPSKGSD